MKQIIIQNINRFERKLPNKDVWDSLSSSQKGSLISNIMNTSDSEFKNFYIKSLIRAINSNIIVDDSSYECFQKIVIMLRKFAENSAFL